MKIIKDKENGDNRLSNNISESNDLKEEKQN